jgi:lysine-specific demethylase 8
VPGLRDDLAFPDVGVFSVDVAWVGPAGMSTPVHFDRAPNVYAQLIGRKRWRLWRPDRPLRPRFGGLGFSMSGLDAGRGPERAGPPDLDVVLEPGDVLVVPERWWHHVDTLEPAFAVNRWWKLQRLGRWLRRRARTRDQK